MYAWYGPTNKGIHQLTVPKRNAVECRWSRTYLTCLIVLPSSPSCRAERPKSAIFKSKCLSRRRFSGLRSRCVTCASCFEYRIDRHILMNGFMHAGAICWYVSLYNGRTLYIDVCLFNGRTIYTDISLFKGRAFYIAWDGEPILSCRAMHKYSDARNAWIPWRMNATSSRSLSIRKIKYVSIAWKQV